MKKLLSLILALTMVFSLCACGGEEYYEEEEEEEEETTEATTEATEPAETGPVIGSGVNPADPTVDVSSYSYQGTNPVIQGALSQEQLDAYNNYISRGTIDEWRQLCVDFFRFTKTALWRADMNWMYADNKMVKSHEIYAGLPYAADGVGSIYRLLDYIDPATGAADAANISAVTAAYTWSDLAVAYQAWGRLVNSANFTDLQYANQNGGFLRVGPYTYSEDLGRWGGSYTTAKVVEENGDDVMMESYAALKMADGILLYTKSSGHVAMVSSDAVVTRNADGTIDPVLSYITIIDLDNSWNTQVDQYGQTYNYQGNIDMRLSFKELLNNGFIPFTFGEFTGAASVERLDISVSYGKETVTLEKLSELFVESNYGITDVYISIRNANGVEVYKKAYRSPENGKTTIHFNEEEIVSTWGDLDSVEPGKYYYTVEISAQSITGGETVLWEGILAG